MRFISGILFLALAWGCAAQEASEFGPDVTAEDLLGTWLGEEAVPSIAPPQAAGDFDLLIHAGAGYKKNVLYSAVHPLDSAFSLVDGELYLGRTLPGDREIYLYGYAEQHHYFDLDRSEDDQNATAELAWVAHPGWVDMLRLAGTYYYIDQFFDSSFSDIEVDSVRLREHDAGGNAVLEKRLGAKWTVRVDGGYREAVILDSDDDYSEWSLLAGADYAPDELNLLSAEFEHALEDYHDRPKRDAFGDPLPGGAIDIDDDRLTLKLRRYLDPQRSWQLRLRGSVGARQDDAGGYYDYLGWRGRAQLRYAADPLSVECGVGYTYLDYDERPARIVAPFGDKLYRSWWIAWLRAEYMFRPPWSGFVEILFEDYDSNDPLNVYDHGWAAGGVGVAF